jgi:hypothetical protein
LQPPGTIWQVTDLVDNQELRSAQEAQALAQAAFTLGLGERGDQLGQGAEVDAAPGLDGFDTEEFAREFIASLGKRAMTALAEPRRCRSTFVMRRSWEKN